MAGGECRFREPKEEIANASERLDLDPSRPNDWPFRSRCIQRHNQHSQKESQGSSLRRRLRPKVVNQKYIRNSDGMKKRDSFRYSPALDSSSRLLLLLPSRVVVVHIVVVVVDVMAVKNKNKSKGGKGNKAIDFD